MDIFPIWKSTFYETETDRVKFRILKWGVQEICRATAVRLPDDELLRIGLNKPCQNYLDSSIDVSATGTTSSNAYAEFTLQVWNESNLQWFNAYEFAFVNDWSYSEHEETGSFSEPINGHAAPGQLIPYTICSTSTTQETICYDEYDFNAYLVVNPATITFDQTGGTATITIFANANWTITQYGNLVTLSQTTGTSGTTTISVICPENLTISEFTDTLRISVYKRGTTATEYLHITQEAATPYVHITSGGNVVIPMSGGTWNVTFNTNIPNVYYEYYGSSGTITGYTSTKNVSVFVGSTLDEITNTIRFYDAPGGTLCATAVAAQTNDYFYFITPDNSSIPNTYTSYTITWATTYEEIKYVFSGATATTTDSGATFTFPENYGGVKSFSMSAYTADGAELGVIHWRQKSKYEGDYLTMVILTGGTVGFAKTTYGNAVQYSLNGGSTWGSMNGSINVQAGDRVLLRNWSPINSQSNGWFIQGTAYFNLEGNLMSLVSGGDYASSDTIRNEGEFSGLFSRTNVVSAENMVLPATTIREVCYFSMFGACEHLVTPPAELPAKELKWRCYRSMFAECDSLTSAPEILADYTALECFETMFANCTSLVTPPSTIYADILEQESCYEMFTGCISLTKAPLILGTTFMHDCCHAMFYDCTSLVDVQESLYATTLYRACCKNMFRNCTSLVRAPELPADDLAEECYYTMFNGCESLEYVKCLAYYSSGNNETFAWLGFVSDSGTFVKNANTTWPTGISGIPDGWTIENA